MTACRDYERGRVRAAVREAIESLPAADRFFRPGSKILLKPNLLSSNDTPDRAINTHPEFVRAVAELFVERGCKVLIGDSCGSLTPGSTQRAISATGIDRVADEVGAEVVDFDRCACVDVETPNYRVLPSFRIPRVAREVDLFVTLPKFKTHGLMLLTGAVKNQFGLIPGRGKKNIHLIAPKPETFAHALLDLHAAARPHLAVMDAIVGMEGNGPAGGEPAEVGLVMAGNDCIALDAVAAEIMGYERGEVSTVRLGHERGLGVGRLEDIRLLGLPLERAVLADFGKLASRREETLARMLPSPVLRWLIEQAGAARATVLEERCVLCGECVRNCPVGAMREVDGRIRVDAGRCITCYCCSEVCKKQAIRMRRRLFGRAIHWTRRLVRGGSKRS